MHLLYNISIYLYVFSIWISTKFNPKAKLWIQGRRGIFKSLEKNLNGIDNIVWIHCSSLGEFEQGRPIIEGYKTKYPEHKILLTFFSPSGFEVKKNYTYADWVYYLPSDTLKNSTRFIKIVNPIKAIFIKYDFWFNYVSELSKKDIPIYLVSSIFRKDQSIIKYSWPIKQLKKITHFFVQNKESKELLNGVKITNVSIAGDTRFDQVKTNAKNPKSLPLISEFTNNSNVIIFGSTWPKDEIIILDYIKSNPQNKYIIAPHELTYLKSLLKITNSIFYSEANTQNLKRKNVLIIDSIGVLPNIYQYGKLAYIGGGFGKGVHNTLEAISFGIPVIFGPNYQKSQEINKLISLGIGESINTLNELTILIKKYVESNYSSKCLDFVNSNTGATKKILNSI